MKIIFLSLFQACLLFAGSQEDVSEPDSSSASPILPQDTNAHIGHALREVMSLPVTTEAEASIWRDHMDHIAGRFLGEITMIKHNGDKLVFRPGNPRLISIMILSNAEFTIEFDN